MTGDSYTAPPPARPYADELGVDPGPLRIGDAHRCPGRDRADRSRVRRGRRGRGAPPRVARPHGRAPRRRPRSTKRHWSSRSRRSCSRRSARSIAETEGRLGRPMTADDVEALTWMYRELAQGITGAAYVEALHEAQRWTRRTVVVVVRGRLRPPAHADARRAAAGARRRRRPARRPAARHRPRAAVRGVHRAVQHHRPARDVGADVLDRSRAADRRPARRRTVPGGSPRSASPRSSKPRRPWADRRPPVHA